MGRLRWGVLVVVLALAVGALAGSVFLPPLEPVSAAGAPRTRVVPAVARSFDDAHTVSGKPEVAGASQVLLTGGGGTVTASSCRVGAEVRTGDPVVSVDGAPRVAIVSDTPLWRDLGPGIRGVDVGALQRALAGRGYAVRDTGVYDGPTRQAVRQLFVDSAAPASDVVSLDRVQWVPLGAGTVSECTAQVGSVLAGGSPLLKTGGGLVAVTLPPAGPEEVAGRAYDAYAGEVSVAVPKDRRITDGRLLKALAGSAAYASWKQDPVNGISVDVRLHKPIAAVGVPPSAVILTDGDGGCVIDGNGEQVKVGILASELGVVFLAPARDVAKVTIPATQVVSTCR